MRRALRVAGYASLFYVGFIVALNTTWGLQERQQEPECQTGCCW